MFSKAHIVFVFVGILMSHFLYAQEDSTRNLPSVSIMHYSLPYAVAKLENASPKYLLNEDFLKLVGAQDIGEAMKYIPGVQVKDYGGIGGIKTASYRSLSASHTGVSIDNNTEVNTQIGAINLTGFESFGMKSVHFTSGQPMSTFALPTAYIPANQINIYSSLGGFDSSFNVKIFQKSSTINAHETGLYIGLPIKNKWKFATQLYGRYGSGEYNYRYNLSGSEETFRRTNSNLLNYKGRAMIIARLNNGFFKLSGYHNKNRQELPGAVILFNPSNDQRLLNEDSRVDLDFIKIFDANLILRMNANMVANYTRYQDPTYLNQEGFIQSSYRQLRHYLGGMITKNSFDKRRELFFGVDAANNALISNAFSNKPNRFQINAVTGTRIRLERWTLEANLAHQLIFDQARSADSIVSLTYNKLSPYAAISVLPFDELWLRFRTFYKRVFRMPTFNDLYYNFIGNTNLKPEDAHLFNIGMNYTADFGDCYIGSARCKNLELSLDGFYSHVQNKIVAIPTKDLFNWSMQNIGKTRIMGVDLNLFYAQIKDVWNWSSTVNFSYNHSVDITEEGSPSYGHQIPYTPKFSGTASAAFGWKGYELQSTLLYSGKRYSLNENIASNQLNPFMDLSFGIAKKFKISNLHQLELNIKAKNVLNNNYEVIRSFPMPGRHYQMTIRYLFK